MVVMNRQDYTAKAQGLLDDMDTFRPLSKDPHPYTQKPAYKHP